MLEHIPEEALKKYKQKSLSSVELLQVCDHLELCPSCRDRLAETTSLDTLFASFSTEFDKNLENLTPHLLPDEIIAYVDHQLEDVERDIADSHLMSCALCRTDIQDLHAFKASLPAQTVKPGLPEKQVGLWHKFLLFWRQSRWGLVIQAAALATVAFFFITTLYLKKEMSGLHNTISELHQKNDDLQKQVESIPQLQSQIAELQSSDQTLSYDSESGQSNESLTDNGKRIAFAQGSVRGLGDLSLGDQKLLTHILSGQKVIQPYIPGEFPTKKEQTMGPEEKEKFFPLLSPRNKVIVSDRPTLRWDALKAAASYRVTVYDGYSNQVAQSPMLSALTWTLPKPLTGGVVYTWEVTAFKEDNSEIVTAPAAPIAPAKFKVLERAKVNRLYNAKRTYNSHLLSGTLYAQAGLLDEAEQEFKALLTENPQSKLVQKLLRSVQSAKRKNLWMY